MVSVSSGGRIRYRGGRTDAETASFGPERRFVFRTSGPGWRFAVRKNQRGMILYSPEPPLHMLRNRIGAAYMIMIENMSMPRRRGHCRDCP